MPGILTEATDERIQSMEGQLRRSVRRELIDNMSDATESNVIVRDLLPSDDLESGDDNGWTADERAFSQDFTGGTADDYNEAYVVDSDGNAKNKVVGFLVIKNQTADSAATEIAFREGKSGNQGVKDVASIEGLLSDSESTGALVNAVTYGVNEHGTVDFWMNEAQQEHIVIEGAVAELESEMISSPEGVGAPGA